jgi:hypothetical protein
LRLSQTRPTLRSLLRRNTQTLLQKTFHSQRSSRNQKRPKTLRLLNKNQKKPTEVWNVKQGRARKNLASLFENTINREFKKRFYLEEIFEINTKGGDSTRKNIVAHVGGKIVKEKGKFHLEIYMPGTAFENTIIKTELTLEQMQTIYLQIPNTALIALDCRQLPKDIFPSKKQREELYASFDSSLA